MRLTFLFLSIFLVSCACPRASYQPCSSTLIPPASASGYSYVVKKGDSLWRIAKNHQVSVEEILKANNMSRASRLKTGQALKIPSYSQSNTKLSFAWPLKGKVISYFGENIDHAVNKGLNIKAASSQEVSAAEAGKVIFASPIKGWGKTIIIQHDGNFYTVYTNIYEFLTTAGYAVKKGDTIARVSAQSGAENNILHFEIRKGHIADNPLKYLSAG